MSTNDTEQMAYIARCKCGAIIMATVDAPEHANENAQEIAACLKAGYTIERVTCEYVRTHWSRCTCPKPQAKAPKENQISLL